MKKYVVVIGIVGLIIISALSISALSFRSTDKIDGDFGSLILDEKYNDTQFFNIDFRIGVIGDRKSGVTGDIEKINEIVDILEEIKLKEYRECFSEGEDYLSLMLSGTDAKYLKVVIDNNCEIMLQTSAAGDEGFKRYQIEENEIDIIGKIGELLSD